MVTSLVAHLAHRFHPHPENVATEAMAFVLTRSVPAREAFTRMPSAFGIDLPHAVRFQPQANDGKSIPDLVGIDAQGTCRFLVENKFWAGLTPEQPCGYLDRLANINQSCLLFIVPDRRLPTFWDELALSAKSAGTELPPPKTVGRTVYAKMTAQRCLAVSCWTSVLDLLQAAVRDAGDRVVESDLEQLRGLCGVVDAEAFLPLSVESITDVGVPRFIISITDLVPELVSRLTSAGYGDVRGLRPTHGWHSAGRYIGIGAAGGWLGVDYFHWRRFGLTPMWIAFSRTEYGRAGEVAEALRNWQSERPPRMIEDEDGVLVPLYMRAGAMRDEVLADLFRQVVGLHGMLSNLTPTATIPTPEERP